MGGLIVGALGATVGGAIAFAVWSLLPDVWRAARWPVSIVVAIMCGLPASRLEFPADATPAAIERTMLEHPDLGVLMAAWKETDPAAFSEFISLAGQNRGGDYSAVFRDPRYSAMVASIGRKLAYLPRAAAVERFVVARDQMLELRLTRPDLCQAVFHNRGVDWSNPPFSRTLHRRLLAVQARALRSSPEAAPQPMTETEVMAAMEAVLARTQAIVGDDINLLSPDAEADGNEARLCEVAAEYFNQISQSREIERLNAGMVLLQHSSQ